MSFYNNRTGRARTTLAPKMSRGFSFLELLVVIIIISILVVVALKRYQRLVVVVERTSMEHDLGVMRSAVSMQMAEHYLSKDMAGLRELIDSNPMFLLSERPNNYLGEAGQRDAGRFEPGNWYYDTDIEALIYLVRNYHYLESELSGVSRIRFKIYPVYSDKKQEGKVVTYISGLEIRAMEPYRWVDSTL